MKNALYYGDNLDMLSVSHPMDAAKSALMPQLMNAVLGVKYIIPFLKHIGSPIRRGAILAAFSR